MALQFYEDSVFPRVNNFVSNCFGPEKTELLQSVSGEVLEIGFGAGLTLSHYPSAVTRIVGVEPNPGMQRLARTAIANRRIQLTGKDPVVDLVSGCAEYLPVSDASYGTVVSIFTLCSVSDLRAAVKEIWRVLAPGGRLHFLEHVIQPKANRTQKLQNVLQPLWGKIACGCRLNRDTLGILKSLDFDVRIIRKARCTGVPNFIGPIYLGTATKGNN